MEAKHMNIPSRQTLTKWRKEALIIKATTTDLVQPQYKELITQVDRILIITQQLIDHQLLMENNQD